MALLVNRHRDRIGVGRLIWDDDLAAVAEAHSRDMARRHFFSHNNPDGRDPFERMSAAGVAYRAAAENLAEGDAPAAAILSGWRRSPGHRRNLENGTYTHHGIGYYEGRWTHVFVRYRERAGRSRQRG